MYSFRLHRRRLSHQRIKPVATALHDRLELLGHQSWPWVCHSAQTGLLQADPLEAGVQRLQMERAWLERLNAFFFLFLLQKMLRKCEVCYSLKLVYTPMKVIDRIKAVTQHFLESSFKKLSIKKKIKMKNPKNTKIYVF